MRILVIDDDPVQLRMICSLLTRGGHEAMRLSLVHEASGLAARGLS